MLKNLTMTASALALFTGLALSMPAQAAGAGVKVGVLTCKVEPGWGYVIGSTKPLHCTYEPSRGRPERYVGDVQKVGVDIGYTDGATMVWAVIAPASDVGKDALEGNYAGATAGAAIGVGAGVNVLIGGLDKSITLQPVSVEGSNGLNVAAGLAEVALTYVK